MSFFAGHSKKTAWKAFAHHQKLLETLGDRDLDGTTVKSVEKIICRVYNAANAEGCNKARAALFSRCRYPEALPPTSDAARWHIARAHFQANDSCPCTRKLYRDDYFRMQIRMFNK